MERLRWLAMGLVVVASCKRGDLRGETEPNASGATQLAIDDDNGRCVLWVDGKRWPHAKGVAAAVRPGLHRVGCADNPENSLPVMVPARHTYRFNYWGP